MKVEKPTVVHRIIDRLANGNPDKARKKRATQIDALEGENKLLYACKRATDMAKQVQRQHEEGHDDEED